MLRIVFEEGFFVFQLRGGWLNLPVDVDHAKQIILGGSSFTARDALHIAVLERRGISRVMSFDAGYDRRPGLIRIS